MNEIFKKSGKKLYLVGGSVRDFLTGDNPKDFDLATDALPDEVLSILGNKYRTNLQGKAFGVVVVYTEDQPAGMEIATFREDVSKGRNPEVKLGVTIEDDVKRRDLTYNSLFYDLDTRQIVDLVGGKEDLKISPASKGATIYFDEISEMSDEIQLQLLDLLRSDSVIDKKYRLISSSRLSLQNLISQGVIREDLFYRLNVVNINLPPLRDRIGDIPDLTKHFLQLSVMLGLPQKTISIKAMQLLQNAQWMGNIRELENFINRLVVLVSDDEISANHVEENLNLIPSMNSDDLDTSNGKLSSSVERHIKRYFDLHGETLPPPGLYNRIMKEIELPLIALSLSATRGNQIKTSELLGINRNTLRKKIKDLDIVVTRSKKMM